MTKKEKLLKEKLNEILNDHSIFEVTSTLSDICYDNAEQMKKSNPPLSKEYADMSILFEKIYDGLGLID